VTEPAQATVYVPTLEGGDRLAACLDSLLAQTVPPQIVVADNGPGEGCTKLLEEHFPSVVRVGDGSNPGFGPSLNRAIRTTGEGPIILLNDDAVAEPGFVEQLLARAGEAEMVAAVLVRESDPSTIDSAGVTVDQTLMAFDFLRGQSTAALAAATATGLSPVGPTGGAGLYSRAAFNQAGGFDERIFLYYEDVDLALRISASGGRCVLAGSARATHAYSGTLGADSPRKFARTGWSRGYLMGRYGITSDPRAAIAATAREGVICAGQLVRHRTLAGLTGRLKGWKEGRALPRRELPQAAVTRLSAAEALSRRRQEHRAMRPA
jgi:GT2 family glycosyltransferase